MSGATTPSSTSPPSGMAVGDDDETGTTLSFHFADPIEPPLPERFTVLEATRDDSQEEDRMRRKLAVADPEVGLSSNCNSGTSNDASASGSGLSSSQAHISLTQPPGGDIQGEQSVEEVAESPPTRNAESRTNVTSTILYDGSDAHCQPIPLAYLVESQSRPSWPLAWLSRSVYHAEAMRPWYKRWYGRALILMAILFVCALVGFGVNMVTDGVNGEQSGEEASTPTEFPSSTPSLAPSDDKRPTLEIVQSRDEIRCGLDEGVNTDSSTPRAYGGYKMELVSNYCFLQASLQRRFVSHSQYSLLVPPVNVCSAGQWQVWFLGILQRSAPYMLQPKIGSFSSETGILMY